jgi:hydrogenase maturation factor
MRVLRIDAPRALALCVDDDGEHHTVEIALVDAEPGDELLVHAGVALVRLEASEAVMSAQREAGS